MCISIEDFKPSIDRESLRDWGGGKGKENCSYRNDRTGLLLGVINELLMYRHVLYLGVIFFVVFWMKFYSIIVRVEPNFFLHFCFPFLQEERCHDQNWSVMYTEYGLLGRYNLLVMYEPTLITMRFEPQRSVCSLLQSLGTLDWRFPAYQITRWSLTQTSHKKLTSTLSIHLLWSMLIPSCIWLTSNLSSMM